MEGRTNAIPTLRPPLFENNLDRTAPCTHPLTCGAMRAIYCLVMFLHASAFANGAIFFSRSCCTPMLRYALIAARAVDDRERYHPEVDDRDLLESPRFLRLRGGSTVPTDAASRHAADADMHGRSLHQKAMAWLRSKPKRWYARALLFYFYARVPFLSILFDDWAAVRSAADADTKASIATEIIRRRRRGAKVQKLIGVGYTPRIVALAGLMLRSMHLSTALPAIWNPPIGLGAGACLAAQWAQREWLACFMVGWYAGGVYWSAMGVAPPPGFAGVPVSVRRVRV